jgi:hypothetical protein
MKMKHSIFTKPIFTLAFLLLTTTFVGCSADPNETDAERVKEQFLSYRFQATFNPETKDLTDKELFEQTCKANRVNCDKVIEILKKKDPAFVDTLTTDGK